MTNSVNTSSGADSIGHRGARAPTYTNGWARGRGSTVSRSTDPIE